MEKIIRAAAQRLEADLENMADITPIFRLYVEAVVAGYKDAGELFDLLNRADLEAVLEFVEPIDVFKFMADYGDARTLDEDGIFVEVVRHGTGYNDYHLEAFGRPSTVRLLQSSANEIAHYVLDHVADSDPNTAAERLQFYRTYIAPSLAAAGN